MGNTCRLLEKPQDTNSLELLIVDEATVAEPPKLYDPHAPVIVPKTSDGYAYAPNNLRSLLGIIGKPELSTIYNSHRINKGVTTTLQHLLQNFTSECGRT
jgi:hypothetical protein